MNKLNTIMFVDDDPTTNFVHKATTRRLKIAEKIITFSNGSKALRHLFELDERGLPLPELIFVDVAMPDLDGHDLIAYIKAIDSFDENKTIVAYLTCNDSYLHLTKADKNDVEYYLMKPLEPNHVLQIVDKFFHQVVINEFITTPYASTIAVW